MALIGWCIGLGLWNILQAVEVENAFLSIISAFIGSGFFAYAGYELEKFLA